MAKGEGSLVVESLFCVCPLCVGEIHIGVSTMSGVCVGWCANTREGERNSGSKKEGRKEKKRKGKKRKERERKRASCVHVREQARAK